MERESDQVATQGFNVSLTADKNKAVVEITAETGMDNLQLATLLTELGVKILRMEAGFDLKQEK